MTLNVEKIFVLALILAASLFSHDLNLNRHEWGVGPEIASLTRLKKGGSRQDAIFGGLTAKYQRLKRYGWYWGGEGAWGYGKLHGHSPSHETIRSNFTDAWAEGRLGYTFQQKDGRQASLTPFLGAGYLWENNDFVSPSRLKLHFKTHFPYVCTGFLFWFHLFKRWEVGLNLKIRYPWEPRSEVSNDPDQTSLTQNICTRTHTRVELPITYRLSCEGDFALSFVPFYENRRYGSHPNFPFNYYKTKMNFWGAALQFLYRL